jgi:hypothetical protein
MNLYSRSYWEFPSAIQRKGDVVFSIIFMRRSMKGKSWECFKEIIYLIGKFHKGHFVGKLEMVSLSSCLRDTHSRLAVVRNFRSMERRFCNTKHQWKWKSSQTNFVPLILHKFIVILRKEIPEKTEGNSRIPLNNLVHVNCLKVSTKSQKSHLSYQGKAPKMRSVLKA